MHWIYRLPILMVSVWGLWWSAAPVGVAAALPAPTLTSPAPGALLTEMGVTLAWKLPRGTAQVHIQVTPAQDDGPGIDVIRNAAGEFTIPPPPTWQALLPGMTYTWRVRATEKRTAVPPDDPAWGPWSETWTFRTPAASSAGIQPVAPITTLSRDGGNHATLRWSHPDPAIFYFEVQASGDTRFDPEPATATSVVWWNLVHGGASNPPNSWQTPPLEPGTTYYWRVRPRVQGDGAPVSWSPTFSFVTAPRGSDAPVVVDTTPPTPAHGLRPGAGSRTLPILRKPFTGDFAPTNFFDHDLPFQFKDANGVQLTYVGAERRFDITDGHDGYDWPLPPGTPLFAVADGKVVFAGNHTPIVCPVRPGPVSGMVVQIEHTIITREGTVRLRSAYHHLNRVDVKVGQRVQQGDPIGVSGNTGCADGPHLHFEVQRYVPGVRRFISFDPYGWEGPGPDPWAQHPSGVQSLWLWQEGQAPGLGD